MKLRVALFTLCLTLPLSSVVTLAATSKTCFVHFSELKRVQNQLAKTENKLTRKTLKAKEKKARDHWWACKNGTPMAKEPSPPKDDTIAKTQESGKNPKN